MGVIPERLKSLENAGLLRYGIAPWQQNDNILRLSKNKELSDSIYESDSSFCIYATNSC